MRNAFGIYTNPLCFRRELPEAAMVPFRQAIGLCLSSLTSARNAETVGELWWYALGQDGATELSLIRELRSILTRHGVNTQKVQEGLVKRADIIARQVAPFLLPGVVVDWGCGDALVASRLIPDGRGLILVDIADQRAALFNCEFHVYDEQNTIDVTHDEVSLVLMLTVLHHARRPGLTLRHASQLASERLILLESVPEIEHPGFEFPREPSLQDRARYEYCGFVDWIYNRVLHENVQVTYNYLASPAWVQMLEAAGFRLVEQQVLGIDQEIVPEWHVLQVYDRK